MKDTYEEWKARVDTIVYNRTGVSSDDLPDIDYISLYEDDYTPYQAARFAIKNAMKN